MSTHRVYVSRRKYGVHFLVHSNKCVLMALASELKIVLVCIFYSSSIRKSIFPALESQVKKRYICNANLSYEHVLEELRQ